MKNPLSRKKTTTVKPKDEQREARSSKPVERDALLANDRNRWFYVSIGLLFLCVLLTFQVMKAHKRFAENVQVAWVKMYPNGTWDVDFYDESRGVDFFQTSIDNILDQWVERRYSKVRHSIESDYGFALQFMAPKLSRWFVDENQFNAAGVVAELTESAGKETVIDVGPIDHFDSDITSFGKVEGTLYRTNVFVTEKEVNPDGSTSGEPRKKIVTLHWRIKSKGEIAANKKMLRINPVGIEILKSEIFDDPSSKQG